METGGNERRAGNHRPRVCPRCAALPGRPCRAPPSPCATPRRGRATTRRFSPPPFSCTRESLRPSSAADDPEAARRSQMREAKAPWSAETRLTQDWRAMCCERRDSALRGGRRKPHQTSGLVPAATRRATASLSFGVDRLRTVAQPSRRFSYRTQPRLFEVADAGLQYNSRRRGRFLRPLAAILKAAIQNAVGGDVSRAFVSLETRSSHAPPTCPFMRSASSAGLGARWTLQRERAPPGSL